MMNKSANLRGGKGEGGYVNTRDNNIRCLSKFKQLHSGVSGLCILASSPFSSCISVSFPFSRNPCFTVLNEKCFYFA